MKCVNATFPKWYSEWVDEDLQWHFNEELSKPLDLYCDFHGGKF